MLLAAAMPAAAADLTASGFADFSLVQPSDQQSRLDGGLGKLRYGSTGDPGPQLQLEGYGRYRRIEIPALEWQFKLGAFFPPISLENQEIGWTSPWTITPSAINSWVGEEPRTIGDETSLERRSGTGSPGWYGAVAWRADGLGRLTVLRYDNRADPTAIRQGQIAWHTQFTSVGAEGDIGEVVILTQGMVGDTEIDPSIHFHLATHFQAAYLLAGWNVGDWTLAGRTDAFATRTLVDPDLNEHGRALTFDLIWRPASWLRLSSEALWLDSSRDQRADDGEAPHQIETQFQFSARLIY